MKRESRTATKDSEKTRVKEKAKLTDLPVGKKAQDVKGGQKTEEPPYPKTEV